jgi:sarcosine oxidase subunit beta
MTEYAIIGGGIAGSSVAYHLSKRTDDPVTVFEQGTVLDETTSKSFALFGYYGDPVQYRMKRYAMDLYNEFIVDPRGNPNYYLIGRLGLATSPEVAERLRTVADEASSPADAPKVSTNTNGVPVEYLDSDDLQELIAAPMLDISAIEGAIHRPKVGYLPPTRIAKEFVERARENGVKFREGTGVTNIHTSDRRVTGLETTDGKVAADEVVCAAGPWNIEVARRAGIEIPVRHTLAPVLKLEPDQVLPHTLTSMKEIETGYSFRGDAEDGTVLVGNNPGNWDASNTYDPNDVPETVPNGLREGMWDAIERIIPELSDATVIDEWVGVRSATPDGNPIVGRTAVEGFSLVAFSTSGIQLSPASGHVVAEQLLANEPTDYYDALSISRFDGYDDSL